MKYSLTISLVSVFVSAAPLSAQTLITNLRDLQQCLIDGWNADRTVYYGDTCKLAPGVYEVDGSATNPVVNIRRGNVTLEGTVVSSRSDTVIRRASSSVNHLITVGSYSGVTIQDLTIDGNRYSYGMNCKDAQNNPYIDANLSPAAYVLIQNVDFINAPGTSLTLGGDSVVLQCNFGVQGPTYATRATGIYLGGSSHAYYNHVAFAGTAGINVSGTNQYIYGNTLSKNRYEQSDGVPGGQLFLFGGTPGLNYSDASFNAAVAANVINGDYWQTPYGGGVINGCVVPSGGKPSGIEVYGTRHRFFNNRVLQHMGTGMQVGGATPTDQITIAGNDPWDPDPDEYNHFIEFNDYRGIWFLGPNSCPGCYYPVTNVTLDHVRVQSNNNYPIVFEQTTGTGFINDACIRYNNPDDSIRCYNCTLQHDNPENSNSCP